MTDNPSSWTRRRLRWALTVVVALASVCTLGEAAVASATVDAPLDVGGISLVDATDQRVVLTSGDADTTFSVLLSGDATCPGDSANDQWRVQSFVIPATMDPLTVQYGPIGPEPWDQGDRYAMFDVGTAPYVQELTRPNPTAGHPGVINAFSPMSFAVIAGEGIANGTYRIGVACTYFGRTAKFWDNEIVITGSSADSPDVFMWRLSSAPASVVEGGDGSGGELGSRIVLVAGGLVAVAAVGWFVWRNRAGRLTTLSKESR